MKKFLVFILFLAIRNMMYAQDQFVEDATKEDLPVISVNNTKSKGSYQGTLETGYSFGVGEWGMNNIRLNFINSISYNPYFSCGLGIGWRKKYEKSEFYDFAVRKWPTIGNNSLFPIFLDFRTNFSDNKVSPLFALDIGGYFGVYGLWAGIKGGFFINPSAGIKFKTSDDNAMIVSLSYELQRMEFWSERTDVYSMENVGSLGINIGWVF